jgi:hypothetical protein
MQLEKGTNMKKSIPLTIFLASVIFSPTFAQAQGTLQASNLGQTSAGGAAVGSDSWLAQPFGTGSNPSGYVLNSVQLFMDAGFGDPDGFSVSIYNRPPGLPPLDRIGSLSGADPSTGGVFTYTGSDITLLPSTSYFVVVTSATPIAQGAYNWSAALGSGQISNGWRIYPNDYYSADGLTWQFSRANIFQMAIYATPVPEPGQLGLITLSGLIFVWHRRTVSETVSKSIR